MRQRSFLILSFSHQRCRISVAPCSSKEIKITNMVKKTRKKVKAPAEVVIKDTPIKLDKDTFKKEPVVEKQKEVKQEVPQEKIEGSVAASITIPEQHPVDLEPVKKGFKHPSITDLTPAHTKKSFKRLMEAYRKQNPKKYALKKGRLEAKLRRLK